MYVWARDWTENQSVLYINGQNYSIDADNKYRSDVSGKKVDFSCKQLLYLNG